MNHVHNVIGDHINAQPVSETCHGIDIWHNLQNLDGHKLISVPH